MSEEEFCPSCERYSEFATEDRRETYTVRGRDIEVPATVEVCAACGETLFDESRDEDLLRAAYSEYRRLEGLLSPDEIRAIRDRYRLSQKSLASLLGMSEATVNRYEGGALQSRTHDSAIRACENPTYVQGLVARNGHLLSEWQRKRVEEALASPADALKNANVVVNLLELTSMPDELSRHTGFRRFDYSRYAAAVVWFCRNLKTAVTQTKLYKLLFYADFLCFKTMSVSLTGAAYRKLQYGPAPADYGNVRDRLEHDDYVAIEEAVYQNGRTGEEYHLGRRADEVSCGFTPEELSILAHVATVFRDVPPTGISEASHREAAWMRTPDKQLISYEDATSLSLALPDDS